MVLMVRKKGNPSPLMVGVLTSAATVATCMGLLRKVGIHLPLTFLDIHLNDSLFYQKDISSIILSAALFITDSQEL